MTDVAIYFSVNNTRLTVAITANGERESYNASNVFVDFETDSIVSVQTHVCPYPEKSPAIFKNNLNLIV